ncbi:MAG: hypothetical protein NVSMB51_00650 [Solirubrobacteraceae bacterium]
MRARLSVIALLVVLAGCGSTSAKAHFISRADAICQTSTHDLDRVRAQLTRLSAKPRNARRLYTRAASLTGAAAAREQRTARELARLSRPAADARAIDVWLTDLRRQASLTQRVAGAFAAQNPKRAAADVRQIKSVLARVRNFAQRYGMQSCGKTAGA